MASFIPLLAMKSASQLSNALTFQLAPLLSAKLGNLPFDFVLLML
jgi:hypothetical protein